MAGRYLTDLADVLRRAGLSVIEVDGWQTRARSSGGYAGDRPWCVMWHHTASQASAESDVAYIVSGSDNAPLANLYLARDGSVHVCAAGATNTNGKGGPLSFSRGTVPLDDMNVYALGVEAGNSGTGEQWPQAQIDAYFALNNAVTAAYGLRPDDMASHAAYAPGRKIDPATAPAVLGPWRPPAENSSGTWSLESIRAECRDRAGGTTPPPPEEELMFTVLEIVDHPEALGGMMDGHGIIAQISWLSPGRYGATIAAGAPILRLSVSDLVNCDLLGPLPPSFSPGDFANVIT